MASPSESEDYFSESEDHVSKTSSQNGDDDEGGSSIEPHRIPLSELRVHHILDEMNLTWSQSQQLHDVMQAEMKSAGLLGEMNFGAQHRQGNSDTLRPIFATVKARLAFLEAANVTRTRLGELLLARAWILNKHEKHNRDMRAKAAKRRAAGKVKAVGEDGEGKEMEPVDAMQQDEVEDVEQPLDAEFPTPRRSSRGVRPSAIAADLGEMDIGTGMIATQREEGQRQVTPGSPMNVDEPVADRIESPARIGSLIRSTTTSIIYPTVFMVRVVNQRTGFAVRSSQLLTEPQRNGYVSIESLSYEMFTTLVSQRLGFNVQGRISGVVPKVHNIALIDSTILITEEVDWQAVLQVWQNHRRSTETNVFTNCSPKILEMTSKRQLSKSTPSMGDSTSRKKRTKTLKSIAKAPDVPIKIHVGGDDDLAGEVYIHRSRLEQVSPWFKRVATHIEVIELDNVNVTTLQAFYTWVYDRCIVVDGMEEELGKVKLDVNDSANNCPTVETGHATASSQSMVVDLTGGSDDDMSEAEDAGESDEASSTAHSSSEVALPWYMTAGLDTRGQIFGQLTDLYSFGTTYEIADFSIAVVLAWQRFSFRTSTYPCTTIIHHICQRVSLKSELMLYIIDCYAHYIPAESIMEARCR
ncbi:hypothetical protein BKA63DRAFT_574194 [Paraphoma chrysanthemicola]|nr:hypothetical protein BKA63DRAFT_574194 [Paraphoma chrysanthemicola]